MGFEVWADNTPTAEPRPGNVVVHRLEIRAVDPQVLSVALLHTSEGEVADTPGVQNVDQHGIVGKWHSVRISQNALPMNGSIRPQYITPIHRNSDVAAMSLAKPGASSPAPDLVHSSGHPGDQNAHRFSPASTTNSIFHRNATLWKY